MMDGSPVSQWGRDRREKTGQTSKLYFPGNLGRAAFVILMMLQDIFVNNVFLF